MTHDQLASLCRIDEAVGEIETDLNTLGIHQPLTIAQLERMFRLTSSIWRELEQLHKANAATIAAP